MGTPPGLPDRHSRSVFAFGPFRLDPENRMLDRDGEPVPLPPRAVDLLACLVASPGQILSKDHLLEVAWPDSFVSEDSLTHAISLVRQALGDDPQSPRYIQTVPRRGYRFVAEVVSTGAAGEHPDRQSGPAAESPSAEHLSAPPGVAGMRSRRRYVLAVAVLVLAVVALAAAGSWLLGGSGERPQPAPLRIERLAIAVFEAHSTPSVRAFADALPAAVADLIERETKLTVLAADAVATDTDAVLGGELHEEDGALAVIARVRDAKTDDNLWRQEWLLPADGLDVEMFARSLVSRLRFLLDLVSPYSTLRRSTSGEATLLTVQASELLLGPAQRDLYVALQAAEALARATQLDPGFARARAGRVAALAEAVGWRPLSEAELAEIHAESQRALADDPNDPIVYIAVALDALLRQDVETSGAALDRALELAPDLFWVYMIRADLELRAGLPTVALATVKRGLDLDPYLHALHGRLVDVQLAAGDLDGAAASIDRLARFDPGGYWSGRALARLYRRRGQMDRAEQELLRLRARWADAPWVHRELADFYREAGRESEARQVERTLASFAR